MMKNTVIVIAGPTASGKSSLGIELARRINGEIISADSMQIYKGLDIGTAKVTEEEMQGVKHYMLDIIAADQKYSVADYKKECYACIDKIIQNGSVPIIVGGTGLYINAVVNNINFSEEDEEGKNKAQEIFDKEYKYKSDEELLEILSNSTNIDVEKIKGNRRRIERYFIKHILSSGEQDEHDLWKKRESPYDFFVVYIEVERNLLYSRIDARVDKMVLSGVVEEAKQLFKLKSKDSTAMQAIGYKEFFPYIEGKLSLQECTDTLKKNTRHYAKRQITWFKKLEPKFTIKADESVDNMVDVILKEYYENIS